MSATFVEAPYVVSHNYCAVRANTLDELLERLRVFNATEDIAEEIDNFRLMVANATTHTAAVSKPVTTEQAVANINAAGIATTVVEAPAAGAPETIADQWGNQWTYGHPDAPDLPDGRGKYALKSGVGKSGKAYKGWFDPGKGPKPFATGVFEAPTIWPKR